MNGHDDVYNNKCMRSATSNIYMCGKKDAGSRTHFEVLGSAVHSRQAHCDDNKNDVRSIHVTVTTQLCFGKEEMHVVVAGCQQN